MLRETRLEPMNGLVAAVLILAVQIGSIFGLILAADGDRGDLVLLATLALGLSSACWRGLRVVQPNEGKVITLFGRYVGSIVEPGLWFVNPFTNAAAVSLRVRNFETTKLKVNDAHGNPIEIGAVVVWRVVDTAEASFEVEDYVRYVHTQAESALRGLATRYPYDAHETGEISLSANAAEASAGLMQALHDRLGKAGVEALDARISHLAYAPEIAQSMLQRQQASAVVAARQKIVEGAVGMVENALDLLKTRGVVDLDDERKAAMVSNLLVVLCSDRAASPVVNAGSIY
jgi:regulator of protease activity HflC (stomatin/prohibitin superfamily)